MANADDLEDTAYRFLEQYEIEYPCMLDAEKQLYNAYQRNSDSFAPYPVHVVIDRQSKIRYLSYQNNTLELFEAIDTALGE